MTRLIKIPVAWSTFETQGSSFRFREESQAKNVTKSGKSPKGGEGSALKIEKSTIQNVDFLIRGGGLDFQVFPKCKCRL